MQNLTAPQAQALQALRDAAQAQPGKDFEASELGASPSALRALVRRGLVAYAPRTTADFVYGYPLRYRLTSAGA